MYREKRFKYQKTGSKYKNKTIVNGGQKYDSILESKVGQDLELKKLAGEIKGYDRQVKIEFNFIIEDEKIILTTDPQLELKNGGIKFRHLFNYYCDFRVYHNDNTVEYLEAKGLWIEPGLTKFKLLEIYLSNKPEFLLNVIKR